MNNSDEFAGCVSAMVLAIVVGVVTVLLLTTLDDLRTDIRHLQHRVHVLETKR